MIFNKIVIIFYFLCFSIFAQSGYKLDDSKEIGITKRLKNSHIKVYLPNMPYIYVSKLINGTLVRSSDTNNGWEYMLATNVDRNGDKEYIFTLRKGVKFQDGSQFDANSVVENFDSFLEFLSSNRRVFRKLKSVKKISNYKVKFILNEPYELFLDELTRINIYSSKYLKKYSWGFKKAYTANNMKEPGPYGLGPYILKKGYATGRKQTSIIELEANPYYYEKDLPYIEKITIYTELNNDAVLNKILKIEGELDIASIPFNKKVETIQSPYAKLFIKPSFQSISIFFNLLKPDSILKQQRIRLALNEAINQENLLKFTYKNEGIISPITANQNYQIIQKVTKNTPTHHQKLFSQNKNAKKYLKSVLEGLKLKVYTMDNLMFLWKGIEYQLNQYGVELEFITTSSEKELFNNILTNRAHPKAWDMLSWSNDSWSSNNPYSVFFHYRTDDAWSSIDKDDAMLEYIKSYLLAKTDTKEYIDIVQKITKRVYDKAYMLSIPSPNKIMAVNKEVYYEPSSTLIIPLWKAKITPYHWSIRKGEYPKERQGYIMPTRFINR